MTFDPKSIEVTCVTLPKDRCFQVPWKIHQSMWIQWPFLKTWTKGHWPLDDLLTPNLLRSHVWLYPRIIASKSHGNTSMYVDTVINLAKLNKDYHILQTYFMYVHTTYRMSNHIVSFWTKCRWDKNGLVRLVVYSNSCRILLLLFFCIFSVKNYKNAKSFTAKSTNRNTEKFHVWKRTLTRRVVSAVPKRYAHHLCHHECCNGLCCTAHCP